MQSIRIKTRRPLSKEKEVELVEPVQKNTYLNNTYQKDSSWLHFDDEPKVQKKQ